MHERQAIKKRVKSLLEGIWLSFYCYPATTGYLFLIISDQQFIDRFSFLGYGTDGTEDADSLDMETGIEVVEEGVLRVLLPGIGVGKHSFGTAVSYTHLTETRSGTRRKPAAAPCTGTSSRKTPEKRGSLTASGKETAYP